MPINEWSENILIAEVNDEPAFSEDLEMLMRRVEQEEGSGHDIIVNMKPVTYVNSTNIAQLLKLRKTVIAGNRRLRICAVNNQVWSVILITGLDKLFEFTDDVSTALASLQLGV
ncbi:MAG: STAS domain-containing protein [Planctomycetota bacterium]|nr:STAS domain-containing protein [Planctomycetota bacterium]